MNEKDFVTAWVLAARAGGGPTLFTQLAITQLMVQAEQIYKQIEQEYIDETDSRTED